VWTRQDIARATNGKKALPDTNLSAFIDCITWIVFKKLTPKHLTLVFSG
jgi:hypothetical protein